MSVISVDEVEARMATGVDVDTLQSVIDQQESWLARKLGQLVGERTITMRPDPRDGSIDLRRPPAESVTVTVNDIALADTQFVVNDTRLDRLPRGLYGHAPWAGVVAVTFTPDDENDVRAALFELVRLALTASPFSQESGEGHSYSRSMTYWRQRAVIARSLLTSHGPVSIPVHG